MMKYLAAAIALASAASASVASADELGQAYRNWGQCNSALSHIFADNWRGQKAGDPKMTSSGNNYIGNLACTKVGEYWYIVPQA
jgi:uncharacterized protein (DUF488 family)